MSLIDDIPENFATLSKKLNPTDDGAKELEKLRVAAQQSIKDVGGEIIQMLYDFRDNMLIFKIKKDK